MSRRYLLGALAAIPSIAFFIALARRELAGEFVPQDIVVPLFGAERLIATGSPYPQAYRDLSVSLPFWNDWMTYNMTPLMAQLFVPIQRLGFTGAWYLWFVISFGAMAGAAVLGWRSGGGALTRSGTMIGALMLLGVTPITAGLVTGRPEFLIALGIGWALVSDRAIIGLVIATLTRVTPALLLLPYALTTARPLATLFRGAVFGGLLLIGLVALAPRAWNDFTFGGVGALIFSMTQRPEILSSLSGTPAPTLALLLSGFTLDPFAPIVEIPLIFRVISWLTSIGVGVLLVLSLRWARDPARRHAALAAASVAMLFGFGILFDYHMVILLPVAAASWAAGGNRARGLLLVAVAVGALVPLALVTSGGDFPSWWHAISLPMSLAVLESARITRLPSRIEH